MTRWKEILGANERTNELEPIGVIDVGSNSVRLVVYEGAVRALAQHFLARQATELGRELRLSEGAIRALEAHGRPIRLRKTSGVSSQVKSRAASMPASW